MINLRWHESAACRGQDTSTFYLDEFEFPDEIEKLRPLCLRCPVFEECLDHSLNWEAHGFWANMTESERVTAKRTLKITRRSMTRATTMGAGYGSYGK